MKRFLVVKDSDIGMLAAILVQNEQDGKIGITAYNKSYEEVLRRLVSDEHFFFEEKRDDRTIARVEVTRSDPRFLDMLKTRIGPPCVVHLRGLIQAATVEEAAERLWKMFSPKESRPITGV